MFLMLALVVVSAIPVSAPLGAGPAHASAQNQTSFPVVFHAGQGKSGSFQALTPQGPVQFYDWGVYFAASEVQLLFENALPSVQIARGGQLESVVNFYVGNNPTQWQKDSPTFQEIYYRDLYPGIDLRYEGLMGQLKSTYTVAAGADPGKHGFITKLSQEGSNPPPPPPGAIKMFMPFLRR